MFLLYLYKLIIKTFSISLALVNIYLLLELISRFLLLLEAKVEAKVIILVVILYSTRLKEIRSLSLIL